MFQKTMNGLCVLLMMMALAGPVQAKVYNGITFDELFDVFDKSGMRFGVRGRLIEVQNGPFVGLADCKDNGRCNEIVFQIDAEDVTATLKQVNKWNQEMKIPEASVNSDGTVRFEMYMTAIGVTEKAILDTTTWFWGAIIRQIDFWDKPVS